MKIAIVFDGLGVGGIERVGLDYIKIIKGLGHKVEIYNINSKLDGIIEEIKDEKIFKYKFLSTECPLYYMSSIKKWWWGKYLYPILHSILKLKINMKKIIFLRKNKSEYDIVIAFSGHINDLTFVSEGFIKANKKICWLHGALIEYICISPAYGLLYSKIKNLCVVSDYGQSLANQGNKFVSELNIKKIYNPTFIGKREIDEEKSNNIAEKYGEYLLMVGRITKQKDQETVIRAMSILKDKYKINKKILFIGDGEEREELEKLVTKLNLDETVYFLGSQLDVQNYYKNAYIAIHSSPNEGFGMVIIEAMSFGVPVVSTKSLPGVTEIIDDNKYGMLCEIGKPEDMANKIKKIIEDEELYEKYSKKGKEKYQQCAPKIIENELAKILKELI